MPSRILPLALLLLAPAAAGAQDLASITALMERGHWKRARAQVEAVARAGAPEAEVAYLRSRVRYAFSSAAEALALAEKAVALDPGNAAYKFHLSELIGRSAQRANPLRQIGLAKRFRAEAEAVIALEPGHVRARWALLQFHLVAPGVAGGDRRKAAALADEILPLDPVMGHFAHAELRLKDKDNAGAEQAYRRALAADPSSYSAHVTLARFLAADTARGAAEAERLARAATALDPARAGAWSVLAGLYARLGRHEALDGVLAEAEHHAPEDRSPAYGAARTLIQVGRGHALAERLLRRYLAQEPEGFAASRATAHWRLAQAIEGQGRRIEAIAELETALRLQPDFDAAKKDLRRLKRA